MPGHKEILEALPSLLEELTGLSVRVVESPRDGRVDLLVELGDRLLVIEAKVNARAGMVSEAAKQANEYARRDGPRAVPVVAVPYMGEVGRRVCSEARVSYVDLSGNASIKAPPLYVHVEGRPNRFVKHGRPASVFAPKSSRVARLLLLNPQKWWQQQELAEDGDIGPGYVSRICKRLEEEGLVDRDDDHRLRPRDPKLLLTAWEDSYDFEKHSIVKGHVSARSGDELVESAVAALRQSSSKYAMTGLAAAWRLAPFAGFRLVTVYVSKQPDSEIKDRLKWREGGRGSNLWFIRPNDEGVFQGGEELNGVRCVSAVQAYLDLRAMPERSDEASKRLREELLPWA
jgi:hypothetical protein